MLAIIQAIPALLALLQELISLGKALQKQNQEASLSNYFQNVTEVLKELRNAKTPDDKKVIAVKLRDLIGGL